VRAKDSTKEGANNRYAFDCKIYVGLIVQISHIQQMEIIEYAPKSLRGGYGLNI